MTMTSIIHPGLIAALKPHFFKSLCTIYTIPITIESDGGDCAGTPVILNGHESIPCYKARKHQNVMGQQQEARRPDITAYESLTEELMLDAYYQAITTAHKATIDGVDYDIRGVVHLGNKEITKLVIERVS